LSDETSKSTEPDLSKMRLNEFLADLADQGFTQLQVATKAGLSGQQLSDIKCGQRSLTELVARRLGDEFDVNFDWLLGKSDTKENPVSRRSTTIVDASAIPIFSHPIEGLPEAHLKWDGTRFDVAGAATAKLGLSKNPYVLRFGHDDQQGRIKKGDLILISQTTDNKTGICVVRHRGKSFLARRNNDGTWTRVADGSILPKESQVTGHCVAILWSNL